MFCRVHCHHDNDRWMNRRFHQLPWHRLALQPVSIDKQKKKKKEKGKEYNTPRMTSSDAIDDSMQTVCRFTEA